MASNNASSTTSTAAPFLLLISPDFTRGRLYSLTPDAGPASITYTPVSCAAVQAIRAAGIPPTGRNENWWVRYHKPAMGPVWGEMMDLIEAAEGVRYDW